MITAGIDMGMETVKVVILKDEKIVGRGKNLSGGAKRASAAEAALNDALREAGLAKADLSKIVATGKGKYDIPFADSCSTEPITAAKAAKFLCPEASTAVDVGADETVVATLGEDKPVKEMAINEKCAAGIGSFLKRMARRLEMTQEEISALPPKARTGPAVNDGCVVFAELDALSLLNRGVSPAEVASAVVDAAAIRACMTINDITNPARDCVVLFGGLTKNAAFVNALQSYAELDFVVPAEAEYAGALGAALVAADWGSEIFYTKKEN
ncbi:MAG: acyl-CoA dehydratase activase [Clostridiales bacterium]|nr:acyl-CoA dehydratase activase [Clostridiales bacterium]